MHFYGWTADYVRKGITGAQGWAYLAYATENEAGMFGSTVERKGAGYIRQEAEK